MNPAFSPLQQHCLDALGYTLYAMVGADAGAQVNDPAPASTQDSRDTQDARDTRLFAAVVRAARVQVAAVVDPRAWLRARGVDSIASLRGDPAAKRALWMALRKERHGP